MSGLSEKSFVKTNVRCILIGVCSSIISLLVLFAAAAASISSGALSIASAEAITSAGLLISTFIGVLISKKTCRVSPAKAFIDVCAPMIILLSLLTLTVGKGTFESCYLISVGCTAAGGIISALIMSGKKRKRR